MTLKTLTDHQLHSQIKQFVKDERHLLTKILHHLAEVDRRKLFCDFGCKSLFEYAVKELKYSDGQAGRRIQAMRLIKEIPAVEKKIESGKLSLSNISQAQSYFREAQKEKKPIKLEEKIEVLEKLENKSSREGQKELLSLMPERPLPKEREIILSESHVEVRFVMTTELQEKLEELRSYLGPKGATMSLAEMVEWMAETSIDMLKVKRFGKKRVQKDQENAKSLTSTKIANKNLGSTLNSAITKKNQKAAPKVYMAHRKNDVPSTPASEQGCCHSEKRIKSVNPRQIPSAYRHHVWMRDKGCCTKCGSRRGLNVDHIKPVALGGESTIDNLRLLCFQCNQRQAIRTFGIDHIDRAKSHRQYLIQRQ